MEFATLTPLSKAERGFSDFRFTVFTTGIINSGRELFQEFFGESAEDESVQRAQFRSEFSLVREGVKYSLVVAGSRVDILIVPNEGVQIQGQAMQNLLIQGPIPPGQTPEFSVLFDPEGALRKAFVAAAEEIVEKIEGVKRMAVGEAVFCHASTKEKAYEQLSSWLPLLKLDPATTSELFLRLNRRRVVRVNDREITVNRLSEWTVPGLLIQQIGVETPSGIAFAAVCRADMNTAPGEDLRELGNPGLSTLVRALFEFSSEIADKGDVP